MSAKDCCLSEVQTWEEREKQREREREREREGERENDIHVAI